MNATTLKTIGVSAGAVGVAAASAVISGSMGSVVDDGPSTPQLLVSRDGMTASTIATNILRDYDADEDERLSVATEASAVIYAAGPGIRDGNHTFNVQHLLTDADAAGDRNGEVDRGELEGLIDRYANSPGAAFGLNQARKLNAEYHAGSGTDSPPGEQWGRQASIGGGVGGLIGGMSASVVGFQAGVLARNMKSAAGLQRSPGFAVGIGAAVWAAVTAASVVGGAAIATSIPNQWDYKTKVVWNKG
jgi:hypothetical protein